MRHYTPAFWQPIWQAPPPSASFVPLSCAFAGGTQSGTSEFLAGTLCGTFHSWYGAVQLPHAKIFPLTDLFPTAHRLLPSAERDQPASQPPASASAQFAEPQTGMASMPGQGQSPCGKAASERPGSGFPVHGSAAPAKNDSTDPWRPRRQTHISQSWRKTPAIRRWHGPG